MSDTLPWRWLLRVMHRAAMELARNEELKQARVRGRLS